MKDGSTFGNSLDRKAFNHLKITAKTFAQSIGVNHNFLEIDEASRVITLPLPEEMGLEFKYLKFYHWIRTKLKILTRLYDLVIEAHIPAKVLYKEDLKFELTYEGFFKPERAYFRQTTRQQEGREILKALNSHRELQNELCKLGLLSLELENSPMTKQWTIKGIFLIGSSTWNFFPPMLYYVKIKKAECKGIVKVFNIISKIIREKEENLGSVAH